MPLLHGRSPARASGLERRVLLEGDVCRESAIATALVNRRWMVLHSPGAAAEAADGGATTSAPASLSSYRHKQDTEPSRTWPITKACSLDAIEHGTYRLREGQSTLYAVATARLGTTRQVDMVRVFVFVCVGGGGDGPHCCCCCCGGSPDVVGCPQGNNTPTRLRDRPLCSSPLCCTLGSAGCLPPRACGCASSLRRWRWSGTTRSRDASRRSWSCSVAAVGSCCCCCDRRPGVHVCCTHPVCALVSPQHTPLLLLASCWLTLPSAVAVAAVAVPPPCLQHTRATWMALARQPRRAAPQARRLPRPAAPRSSSSRAPCSCSSRCRSSSRTPSSSSSSSSACRGPGSRCGMSTEWRYMPRRRGQMARAGLSWCRRWCAPRLPSASR